MMTPIFFQISQHFSHVCWEYSDRQKSGNAIAKYACTEAHVQTPKACFILQLHVASYVSLATRNVLCFEMDYTLQLRYVTN